MKTTVYVDGYNLYYSLLRSCNLKWLDLRSLFQDTILFEQDPNSVITSIKYYTAPVKAKFARHGAESVKAQNTYHRALESTGLVKIVEGSHSVTIDTPMVYKNPPDTNDRVRVWSIEEKHTDVNIALDMYRDAARGSTEQVVLCSNDTDLVGPLRYLMLDFPQIIRGLVVPVPRGERNRRVSESLAAECHWVRRSIGETELKNAQFNDRVATRKKPADKPKHW